MHCENEMYDDLSLEMNNEERLSFTFFSKVIVIGIWTYLTNNQIENRVEKHLWNGTERMRVSRPILRPRKIRVCVCARRGGSISIIFLFLVRIILVK